MSQPRLLALPATLALSLFAGCEPSGPRPAPDAFVPAPELARSALAASLQAWRDGRPTGPASVAGVAVEVSDSGRDPARPLRGFTILGPIGADDRRCFAVRLTFDDPAGERTERYLVMGRNPIWVFRQDDYDRISHWEHEVEDEAEEDAPDATSEAAHAHDPPPIDAPPEPSRR